MPDQTAEQSWITNAESMAVSTMVPGVASFYEVVRAGTGGLAKYLEQRTERRYQEFIDAAQEGNVFPENAEHMSADDFAAILGACESDIESEKSRLYGRLAGAIAIGEVRAHYRRYLILSLSQLNSSQVERLRRAWVAHNFNLMPSAGSGRKSSADFLGQSGGLLGRIDYEALSSRKLVEGDVLTEIGSALVKACFKEDELKPDAIGAKEWANNYLHILCYEMGDSGPTAICSRLSEVARSRSFKSSTYAPRHSLPMNFIILAGTGIFVLLVGQKPNQALDNLQWVEPVIRVCKIRIVIFLDEISELILSKIDNAICIDGKGVAPDLLVDEIICKVVGQSQQ